jgi:pyruvate formate lyase activating enzyme
MKEAMFYEPLTQGRVLCTLCALACKIASGRRGACGVRVNVGDKLYTLVDDRVIAREVDPIEKKPLFHFFPGSRSYSIATVGCNFRCLHCQNYEISQHPKAKLPPVRELGGEHREGRYLALQELQARIPGERVTPEQIVRTAQRRGCHSIAYTYTEPTIFFELAYDTARCAAAAGLRNVFVTNGYITADALRLIAPYLDAANIDLKSYDDHAHRRMTGAPLQPVLDSIRTYHQLGIWIEVTTLVIPGHNDSDAELRHIAEFICGVSPAIPWHVTRFSPAYRLLDRPPTPVDSLRRARAIGHATGLQYVYDGNVPGTGGEDTYCHACGRRVIERFANTVVTNSIRDGRCPQCGTAIPGVGLSATKTARVSSRVDGAATDTGNPV